MSVVLEYHFHIILSTVYFGQAFLKCCILDVFEYGFHGIADRSSAAGKPDIQHRTDWDSASVFFPVVETKSAIAVSPGVFVWAAFSASAALYAAGRTFHHRLHTVEGWGIGKIHFVSSFS